MPLKGGFECLGLFFYGLRVLASTTNESTMSLWIWSNESARLCQVSDRGVQGGLHHQEVQGDSPPDLQLCPGPHEVLLWSPGNIVWGRLHSSVKKIIAVEGMLPSGVGQYSRVNSWRGGVSGEMSGTNC